MTRTWCYGVPFLLLLSVGTCQPTLGTYLVDSGGSVVSSNGSALRVAVVSRGDRCDKMEEYNWYSDFHDCFVDRKYKDGGRDLNNIIDRVLNHAETCVESSRRPCTLDYEGFKFLMNKVIEQMKDFSTMYMEAIIKGREDVKDLECVEDVLSIQSYVECFEHRVPPPGDERAQSIVQEGLTCANQQNRGCSNEALTTLNRIVRTLLGLKHPDFESFENSTPIRPPTTSVSREDSSFHIGSFDWSYKKRVDPEPTPEPPMKWYDYIFKPFVAAWNWVSSWFG